MLFDEEKNDVHDFEKDGREIKDESVNEVAFVRNPANMRYFIEQKNIQPRESIMNDETTKDPQELISNQDGTYGTEEKQGGKINVKVRDGILRKATSASEQLVSLINDLKSMDAVDEEVKPPMSPAIVKQFLSVSELLKSISESYPAAYPAAASKEETPKVDKSANTNENTTTTTKEIESLVRKILDVLNPTKQTTKSEEESGDNSINEENTEVTTEETKKSVDDTVVTTTDATNTETNDNVSTPTIGDRVATIETTMSDLGSKVEEVSKQITDRDGKIVETLQTLSKSLSNIEKVRGIRKSIAEASAETTTNGKSAWDGIFKFSHE